jgi:hypothetical protein
LVLLADADVDVVEVVVHPQLQDLHPAELLRELGETHPETFPAVLGDLQQGLVLSIGPAHGKHVVDALPLQVLRPLPALLRVHDVVLPLAFVDELQQLAVLAWIFLHLHAD